MELLKLSKFKLQLQSMIGEVRDLRVRRQRFTLSIDCIFFRSLFSSSFTLLPAILQERERSVTDHLNLINQKQKHTEEESSRKVHELESEIASSRESQEALERKVSYLQNDYSLLENKQNELKNTIQNLLQSRESFLNAYQESFSEMRCSVEARDRNIAILHQKITSHLALFDSIEKEASAIKNVIQEVQGLVDQKEDVVAGLKGKMDHVSTYEKVFIEKIRTLEEKIEYLEAELQSKDNRISEFCAQLEEAKMKNEYQLQIEEFQKTLKVKDLVVENLVSEKEALHSEVRSLEMILLRIQESVTLMTEEDRRVFTSILTYEQGADERNNHSRYNDTVDKTEELACEAPILGSQENSVNVISSASPRCPHQNTGCSLVQNADHRLDSAQSLQHNTVSGHGQSTNNNDHFDPKDKCKELTNQPDSECSTNRV
ncbi:cingulin-like isoform X1 [Brassica napus]|uniref:cingulin-like isoform X1 n=1 Tax=Brassica napus TaxID=3708 RepID=UPI0020797DD1|nr:cingulin-like isoform X1 [Brassica napus]